MAFGGRLLMAASRFPARSVVVALCCCVILAFAFAARGLPAQETEQAKQPAGEQRLEAIEKALQSLIKEVQSLKQPAGNATESAPAARPGSTTTATYSASAKAPDLEVDAKWLKSLNWRSIGPANMGGRI